MQRATKSDAERWLALFLRHACAPRWSIKALALSSASFNAIEKRLRMIDAFGLDEIARLKRDINHKQLMIKCGIRLGLGARELSL